MNRSRTNARWVVKLVRHDSFDFVLCQIFPFLNIQADMELRKRISRYQSVIVRTHDTPFSHMQFSQMVAFFSPRSAVR